MLETIVRRLLAHIGIVELTQGDVINVIRVLKLDKLPSTYVFLLSSILPILELILKKLQNESVDWGDLMELPD